MNSSGGETREEPSGWTTDTLRQSMLALRDSDQRRIEKQLADLNERLEGLIAASDLRYSQRFDAQQEAVQAALLAAKEAVQTALLASEKAVLKAETASDKRFESVNEFRAALNDQQRNLMPRQEYDARHQALSEKIEAIGASVSVLANQIENRAGRTTGASGLWGYIVGGLGLLLSLIVAVVVIINATRIH